MQTIWSVILSISPIVIAFKNSRKYCIYAKNSYTSSKLNQALWLKSNTLKLLFQIEASLIANDSSLITLFNIP